MVGRHHVHCCYVRASAIVAAVRIAITNCEAQNGGDAAITFALYRRLHEKFPNLEIECHDARPDIAARLYPAIRWRPGVAALIDGNCRFPDVNRIPSITRALERVRQFPFASQLRGRTGGVLARSLQSVAVQDRLADFRSLDAIVSTGGTYLVESYPLDLRFFEYRLAAAAGTPVLFFTQSLGPFDKCRNQRFAREVFEHTPLALLRDEKSLRHLRDVGVRSKKLRVVADGVFAEGDDVIRFPRAVAGRPLKIGVSVRRFPPDASLDSAPMRRFAGEMAAGLSQLLQADGTIVTFVSTCQGVAEYADDDSALAAAIVALAPPEVRDRLFVDRGFHDPAAFRQIVSEFDLYVSTRMHGAIQALSMGTPVVPIAYEFKTNELFGRLGMSNYVLDMRTLTGPILADRIASFMSGYAEMRPLLTHAVRQERRTALRGMDMLCEALRPFVKSRPSGDNLGVQRHRS
jgi:colanic acid/amylovoran biosynthesis protein